jgi:hypothetical protein
MPDTTTATSRTVRLIWRISDWMCASPRLWVFVIGNEAGELGWRLKHRRDSPRLEARQ